MRTICRQAMKNGYVQIPNEMLRNNAISLKARGLLAMILTHSDEWVVSKQWILDRTNEGKDSISAAFRELEEHGYATFVEVRVNGKIVENRWTFFDYQIPETERTSVTKKRVQAADGKAADGFSVSGKTASGKPATKNTICSEDHEEENQMTEHSADAGCDFSEDDGVPEEPELELDLHGNDSSSEQQRGAQPPVPRPPLQKQPTKQDVQAEELYRLYPRKEARPRALRAIKTAIRKVGFEALKAAVVRYVEQLRVERKDPRYIPYPATWFNDEGWNDLAVTTPPGASKPVLDPKAARISALKKSIWESPAHPRGPNGVDFPLPETKEKLKRDIEELKRLEAQ